MVNSLPGHGQVIVQSKLEVADKPAVIGARAAGTPCWLPNYEMIFDGNIIDRVKIARICQQNIVDKERILKSDKD